MQAGTTGELSFDCVTVRFPDGTVALDGFSLHLGRGEFVSVVGPSGCGKSTLLRVAAGLQETDAGTTEVPGVSASPSCSALIRPIARTPFPGMEAAPAASIRYAATAYELAALRMRNASATANSESYRTRALKST